MSVVRVLLYSILGGLRNWAILGRVGQLRVIILEGKQGNVS